jgi:hypothetical protein
MLLARHMAATACTYARKVATNCSRSLEVRITVADQCSTMHALSVVPVASGYPHLLIYLHTAQSARSGYSTLLVLLVPLCNVVGC